MVIFHCYVSSPEGTQSDTVWVIMFQVPMAIGHPMPFHGSISCVLQASPIVERGSTISTVSFMIILNYVLLCNIIYIYIYVQYCTITILNELIFTIRPWDRSPSPHRVPRWVSAPHAAAFGQCGLAGRRCCRFGSVSHRRTWGVSKYGTPKNPLENGPFLDDQKDDLAMKKRDVKNVQNSYVRKEGTIPEETSSCSPHVEQ